jgi:hypothetical protein
MAMKMNPVVKMFAFLMAAMLLTVFVAVASLVIA